MVTLMPNRRRRPKCVRRLGTFAKNSLVFKSSSINEMMEINRNLGAGPGMNRMQIPGSVTAECTNWWMQTRVNRKFEHHVPVESARSSSGILPRTKQCDLQGLQLACERVAQCFRCEYYCKISTVAGRISHAASGISQATSNVLSPVRSPMRLIR